jgi:hypothetical protein
VSPSSSFFVWCLQEYRNPPASRLFYGRIDVRAGHCQLPRHVLFRFQDDQGGHQLGQRSERHHGIRILLLQHLSASRPGAFALRSAWV